jgi:hypothetical protein
MIMMMIMRSALIVMLLAASARADHCDETRYRIAYSVKGHKPIAIGPFADGPTDKPVFGKMKLVDLDGNARPDLLFESGCIKGVTESTRLHRVFAACGKHVTDREDEYALIFDEEVPCTTKLAITRAKTTAAAWHDLALTRAVPRKQCMHKTIEVLRFDGTSYAPHGDTRVIKGCK